MNKYLVLAGLLLGASAAMAAEDKVIWNGGISLEERAQAPAAGTKLVFFGADGKFLAEVHVIVKDAAGKAVVDTVAHGPWLILDLPAGRYAVQATLPSGDAQGSYIDVDGNPHEFGYMFGRE